MASLRFPYSVDLRPVGACNLRCAFCFGPRHEEPTMGLRAFSMVAATLAKGGTRVVVISGGEPLLLKYLPIGLGLLKALGLDIVLSTNGLLLGERMHKILPHLSWLSLPIDSSDSAINDSLRLGSVDYLAFVAELLQSVRSYYPAVGIKLGTVVNRVNRSSVAAIPSLLLPKSLPDVWKLYQFSPVSYGHDNRTSFAISDEEFEEAVELCREAASRHSIRLATYRNATRSGKYLFIEPTGDAVVVCNEEERCVGNLLNDPEKVAGAWPAFVDEARLYGNVVETYPPGVPHVSNH